ncbi:MAG: glycosyltransferase family 4 protein [Kiritimatiellia bacterium]|nr:glycosyltransferase family 4 protein [Kiritimatiellia bacterium]MDP6630348.1 glycosyltransferase family 4 protein [Kiritimatiellia bacterium]MDP6810854.1 glycosyltransferase family 4 protein [Kiritimatiellia bacterium]MDP7024197.1 glycosyltransferase family 4 protein [Kiritimatiellia bacterium]
MRILLLAPHPFYQERGTPIAVRLLAETLAEDGHTIDLLCYHEGDDVEIHPSVTVHRSPATPGVHGIKPGFTLKKLLCDAWMAPAAMRMAREGRYDIVHAVEESVFMAMRIQKRTGLPYIFDMDSSMPRQIVEKLPWMRPLLRFMCVLEERAIRRAAAVVPVCDYLADIARESGAAKVAILRDVPMGDEHDADSDTAALDLPALKGPVFLYVGNLERYQGIDLMVEAFDRHCAEGGAGSLLIVGGAAGDVEAYRQKVAQLNSADRIVLTGTRPVAQLPLLLQQADILVSPRIKGGNTPMKVYSYLASGKPVLATTIDSHTQVMTSDIALLADPTPAAFATGMQELASNPDHARSLGEAGAARARKDFSLTAYRQIVHDLYAELVSLIPPRA